MSKYISIEVVENGYIVSTPSDNYNDPYDSQKYVVVEEDDLLNLIEQLVVTTNDED